MLNKNTLRIFLVNEDLFSMALHQQVLQNMGYTGIRLFYSEEECLQNIAELPDVVLLHCTEDMQKGIEMLRTIKYHHPCIYVVFVSNNEDRAVIESILKQGAFEHITSGSGDTAKMQLVFNKIEQIQSRLKNRPGIYRTNKDNN